MLIIENNLIPAEGYLAMNLFGIFFVRKDAWKKQSEESKKITVNHESIHTRQFIETGFIVFYVIYLVEYLVRLFAYGFDTDKAYYNVSFEREAYLHEEDQNYLKNRRPYAMWRRK